MVTKSELEHAFVDALGRFLEHGMVSSSDLAGNVIVDGKEIALVYVKVIRYSKKRLKKKPLTGGLFDRV